jgi:hypothetical protein
LGVSANLAYHKTITQKLRLAVGLKVGYFNYVFDVSKLDINQKDDPTFGKTAMNIHAPTTGFGTYLYSDRFFLGFSCPQMLFLSPDEINYQHLNHYQLSGGVCHSIQRQSQHQNYVSNQGHQRQPCSDGFQCTLHDQ